MLSLFFFSSLHVCSSVNVLFYDRPHLRERKKRLRSFSRRVFKRSSALSRLSTLNTVQGSMDVFLHVCEWVRAWMWKHASCFSNWCQWNILFWKPRTILMLQIRSRLNADLIIVPQQHAVYKLSLLIASGIITFTFHHVIYCNFVLFSSFRSLAVGKMTAVLSRGGRHRCSCLHPSCLWPQQWKMW